MNTLRRALGCVLISLSFLSAWAQPEFATRSGFSWIDRESVTDPDRGAGYTAYAAAWPIFDQYPGPDAFQMGLASCWMTTEQTGNEPDQFYTTIEGGLGWWMGTLEIACCQNKSHQEWSENFESSEDTHHLHILAKP